MCLVNIKEHEHKLKLAKSREEFFDDAVWVPHGKPLNWFNYVGGFVVRPVLKAAFRYEVHGAEKLPKPGGEPYVLACNHVSFLDPCIMWCLLFSYSGGSRFLARTSLFKPVLGDIIARAGAIPIEPDSADRTAIKRAAAALKRGENLLIFPEGTRMNTPDKEYHPHAGVVLIANMGKAKIIPVGIAGTEKVMPYGSHFPRFPRVHVYVGDPIDPKDDRFTSLPKKEKTNAILDEVMSKIFALRDSHA